MRRYQKEKRCRAKKGTEIFYAQRSKTSHDYKNPKYRVLYTWQNALEIYVFDLLMYSFMGWNILL